MVLNLVQLPHEALHSETFAPSLPTLHPQPPKNSEETLSPTLTATLYHMLFEQFVGNLLNMGSGNNHEW